MTILERLPATELQLKCIYHGMPSAYYHALLTVTDRGKLHALLAALEDAPSPTAVPAHRISEIADAVPEPEDDGAAGKPALCLPPPPMNEEAIRATHKVAWQVVHTKPENMVDITEHWKVQIGLEFISVRLDNASHHSGIQRIYVTCCCKRHRPCFKYANVTNFPTAREGVAWCAAWAAEPLSRDKHWSKAQHTSFAPDPAVVADLVPHAERVEE